MTRCPIDVPTRATVSFVESAVPHGASIIEVGCGAGHVAIELLKIDYRVTGIESDEQAAAQASDKGVDVVAAQWPNIVSTVVDAIIFTRSLHHIHDLDHALRKARDLLRPGGLLLAEEFAFDAVDSGAACWLQGVIGECTREKLLDAVADEFLQDMSNTDDPLSVWQAHHDHGLHSAEKMVTAMSAQFSVDTIQPVPYLYRYLVPGLRRSDAAASFLSSVVNAENRLGSRGDLPLIGRRFVAAVKPAGRADH